MHEARIRSLFIPILVALGVFGSSPKTQDLTAKAIDIHSSIRFDNPLQLRLTPIKGQVVGKYTITSGYGWRRLDNAQAFHRGIDLNTPIGTPVYPVRNQAGFVFVHCYWNIAGGGLVAEYESNHWKFFYLHLSKCSSGIHLTSDVIALTGDSGISTGPHFHFGQRRIRGGYVPPQMRYIKQALLRVP